MKIFAYDSDRMKHIFKSIKFDVYGMLALEMDVVILKNETLFV